MSFFRKILHFFFPPKKTTSMSAVKAALKTSRVQTNEPLNPKISIKKTSIKTSQRKSARPRGRKK